MKYVLVFIAFCTIADRFSAAYPHCSSSVSPPARATEKVSTRQPEAMVAEDERDERCDPSKKPPLSPYRHQEQVYVFDISLRGIKLCRIYAQDLKINDKEKYINQFATKDECREVCHSDN
ncbi:uncharacterized protein [Anabrus simplex]|uniref:uncharacterized protein n=1 Tax=Anabrus simplex TaxID=316456 RepID=UPI0035A388FB